MVGQVHHDLLGSNKDRGDWCLLTRSCSLISAQPRLQEITQQKLATLVNLLLTQVVNNHYRFKSSLKPGVNLCLSDSKVCLPVSPCLCLSLSPPPHTHTCLPFTLRCHITCNMNLSTSPSGLFNKAYSAIINQIISLERKVRLKRVIPVLQFFKNCVLRLLFF